MARCKELICAWLLAGGLVACGAPQTRERVSQVRALHVPPLAQPFEAPYAVFEAALFFVEAPLVDPVVTLRAIVTARASELEIIEGEGEPTRLPAVFIATPKIEDYAPPSAAALEFFGHGLLPDERRSLSEAKQVFTLLFVDHGPGAERALLRASSLLIELSERTGGYVWDESTRELFSREAFQARSGHGAMSVIDHVAVHAEPAAGGVHIKTLGMAKLALPEITLRHVREHDVRAAGILLHVLCQHLIEGKTPGEDGVLEISVAELHDARVRGLVDRRGRGEKPRVPVILRDRTVPSGESEERVVELFFGEGDDPDVHTRRARALSDLLGTEDIAEKK